MPNYPGRRSTVGGAAGNGERDIELASSVHSDASHLAPADFTRRGIGTRSIYGVPMGANRPNVDPASTQYSQTPDSIRDRTMFLSNLELNPNLRESIPGRRGGSITFGGALGSGASRRSSMDDRVSLEQILAEARPRQGNLAHMLREQSPPSLLPANAVRMEEDGRLPPMDPNYWGDAGERVPKNAKMQQRASMGIVPPSGRYGSIGTQPGLEATSPKLSAANQTEHTRLLSPDACPPAMPDVEAGFAHMQRRGHALLDLVTWPLQYLPAVILGLILNLLDGLSYGLIAFPVSIPVFDKFGPIGFSMYMLSTAVSQFVFSSGASSFRGANGCMLIEAIPFLYAMCDVIVGNISADQPERIVATTLASYAISSIITGAVFFILGLLKLGSLVDFFPRHILVGCIGGVGYFLFQTGMEVTSQLKLTLSWEVLKELFVVPNTLGLWTSSLGVAILLRVLNHRFTSPLFVPLFFMAVPVAFYGATASLGLPMDLLRKTGWVFQLPDAGVPFYHFYTLFDFGNTDWHTVWLTVPTMLGLAFFSILHVPINVPALAVSTNADKVDTNRELVAHGISNCLSGMLGSFQNYLVYSNSLLFIRSGGDSNLAGMMLGVATMAIFFAGPTIIGYIPTMVVGALIFHLGLELMKEAMVDTIGVVNRVEYATIILIVLAMAGLGFNEGIFLGILLACFFFILLYSRRSALRKAYTGSAVRSTVRRLYRQRHFLDEVCQQIQVMRLQGFMFFGTINGVEAYIRKLLDQRQWEENPIRFLVLDFALVTGMDFSAAEAFIRVRRLLESREIYMVIAGVARTSEVGRALRSAGVWSDDVSEYVQTSPSLNEALEWCENVLLQYYYIHQAALGGGDVPADYAFVTAPDPEEFDVYGTSPRQAMVTEATQAMMRKDTLVDKTRTDQGSSAPPAPRNAVKASPVLPLLMQAFQDLETDQSLDEVLGFIAPHFQRKRLGPRHHLWVADSVPVGMYVVESGTLRVYVDMDTESAEPIESILPGTTLGELALVTGRTYSTTVVTDGGVTLWELSKKKFDELCAQDPAKMLVFTRLALAYSAQGMSTITAYAFTAQ
ncbi:hypothetical protein FBU59_001775 [Linderina macrospora]|uniref:Uncharacterized protein n=1 Tax=Linderina macrospora TaxID=4868 RepID=A0ACC1JDA2_9FUNG|nr:hypothetical protein FBU59_001775 [Linderina macrospora]